VSHVPIPFAASPQDVIDIQSWDDQEMIDLLDQIVSTSLAGDRRIPTDILIPAARLMRFSKVGQPAPLLTPEQACRHRGIGWVASPRWPSIIGK